MDSKSRIDRHKRAVINVLTNNFPFFITGASVGIGLILAVIMIALQIVAIALQAPFYFVGIGIWVGVVFIIANIANLVLLIFRTYTMYRINKLIKYLSIPFLMSLVALHLTSTILCNSDENDWRCRNHKYEYVNTLIAITGLLAKINLAVSFICLALRIRKEERELTSQEAGVSYS